MKKMLTALIVALSFLTPAMAQGYPDKTVKVIIPYAAGQSSDIIGRLFATGLAQSLGQSFVPDNRVGAGGNIGSAAAAKSAPDGYTLLIGTAATHALNLALYKDPGYDASDFEVVGMLGKVVMVIAVPAGSGVTSLPDLIAKSKGGSLNVALPSTMATLVGELLKNRGGSSMVAVPYKGSAAAVADALGNHVQVIIDTVTSLRPHVQSGKIVPLAVTTLTPSELLPGVKSVAEYFPGFEVTGWQAVFVPKGTPKPVIDKLNLEIKKIHGTSEARQKILSLGFDPGTVGEPAQLAEFVRSEREKWDRIIKAANLKAE